MEYRMDNNNKPYELDPYEILQVEYNSTLNEIRTSFKKLVLQNHPDKGGNPQYFNIIKGAYSYIYQKIKEENKFKKRRNITMEEYVGHRDNHLQQNQTHITEEKYKNMVINPQNFNIQNFNNLYKQYRIEETNDHGYGDNMEESKEEREDIKNLTTGEINDEFDKQELIIYEEPNPMTLLNGIAYKELGEEHINNFTNKNRNNINYTDYKQAYSKSHQITSNTKNVRNKTYSNVDDLISSRSKISYDLSTRDEKKLNMKKRENERREAKRLWRLNQNDEQVFDKYQQMQHLIKF